MPIETDTTTRKRATNWRRRLALLGEIVPLLILVTLAVVGVRTLLQPYQVVGGSMAPALVDGERLFVNRSAYAEITVPGVGVVHPFSTPQRGDIVVLESGQTLQSSAYIKRIIALPGETVGFAEGIVLIDGEPLVEDYIDGAPTRCFSRVYCRLTVPEGMVYVLGDNRRDSEDSRVFGPVAIEDILGRAYFTNWPREEMGPIVRPDYGELSPGAP